MLDPAKTDDDDMFATQANNNGDKNPDEIPDYHLDRNQACKTPLIKENVLSMISPVAQLTVLNTSVKKSSSKTSSLLFGNNSAENTPEEAE